MKKTLAVIFIFVFIMSAIPTYAAPVGTITDTAYNTDIVAYINHYAIPSFAINGTSVIVAEDLINFGFNVEWDNSTRSLTISRNKQVNPNVMNFSKTGASGSKFTDILATDISVYADGKKLTSYAMSGYTMIPIEELTMFGECYWVAEERAIKLWVDGLNVRHSKQDVSIENITTNNHNENAQDSEALNKSNQFTLDDALLIMRNYLSKLNTGMPGTANLFTPIAYEYGIDEKGEYYLIQCESWFTDLHFFKVYYDGTVKDSTFVLPE